MRVFDNGSVFGMFVDRAAALAAARELGVDPAQLQFEIPKEEAIEAIRSHATRARVRFAGTGDPVKLAEYIDKAALATRLVNDTATDDEKGSALGDHWALANDITDASTVGREWQKRAQALRLNRNTVNRLEAEALRAIEDAEPLAVEGALKAFEANVDAALAPLLGGA